MPPSAQGDTPRGRSAPRAQHLGGGRWRSRGAAVGRRGWPQKPATALRLATATYTALLAAVTLLPIQWDPWRVSYPNEDHTPQLVPLRGSGTNPFQSSHPIHMLSEQVGNILLFLPFGLLLPLRWPQLNHGWRVMALGVGTSLGIELAQMAMTGIHRADVNDVLLNALGASLGWLTLRLTQRTTAHRQTSS
jgi:glycopeptide antibiotics resistance protein